MKILTLNTWTQKGPWKERWKIIFQAVRELRPDILAFQEIFSRDWAEEVQETIGYPSLVYTEESETSGLAILSKFAVRKAESFKLETQSPNFEPRRYLLFAEIETGKALLSFFNTHLTWRPDEESVRECQVSEILKFAGQKSGPAVLCGDFNAAPDTPEVKKAGEAFFFDTYETVNPGSQALTWDNKNPYAAGASVFLPDRRIDFIFMRGLGRPKTSEIVLVKPNENGVYASDHYGVLTTVIPE